METGYSPKADPARPGRPVGSGLPASGVATASLHDRQSMGAALVHEARADFQLDPAASLPGPVLHLGAGAEQPIRPKVSHQALLIGPVR